MHLLATSLPLPKFLLVASAVVAFSVDAVEMVLTDGRSGAHPPPHPPIPVAIDPTQNDDPCVNAAIGGQPTTTVTSLPELGTFSSVLGGNNSACLSRIMGGTFVSNDGRLVTICSSPAQCVVSAQKA